MRKISLDAAKALLAGRDFYRSNTQVVAGKHTSGLYLFGNHIAEYDHDSDRLDVNFCGWFSNTTKDRLNTLLWEYNSTRPFYSGCDCTTDGWIAIPLRKK